MHYLTFSLKYWLAFSRLSRVVGLCFSYEHLRIQSQVIPHHDMLMPLCQATAYPS